MSNNGRADIVGPPIELGDFLPERRQVKLNGNFYDAWVTTNHRYPRSVMVKLDRAARVYNRVIDPLLPEDQRLMPLTEEELPAARLRAIEEQPTAWADYVQEAIRLLVPGTQESELELVDTNTLHDLGQQLGYFPPNDRLPDEVPESAGEETSPLTGDTSLLDSGASIPEPTPTSS